jgi:hypothetical protein
MFKGSQEACRVRGTFFRDRLSRGAGVAFLYLELSPVPIYDQGIMFRV